MRRQHTHNPRRPPVEHLKLLVRHTSHYSDQVDLGGEDTARRRDARVSACRPSTDEARQTYIKNGMIAIETQPERVAMGGLSPIAMFGHK